MQTKLCSKCKKDKPVSEFWKRADRCKHLYRSSCISCLYKHKAEFKKKNPEKVFKQNKAAYKKYKAKPKIRARNRNRELFRYKTDIQFKLRKILRARLRDAVLSNAKAGSAVSDLGCSIEEFKTYIESQFEEGMTWKNWSHDVWHIDHIKPLSSFDLSVREQFLQACHYTNLRPMWATDNLQKHTKLNWEKDND